MASMVTIAPSIDIMSRRAEWRRSRRLVWFEYGGWRKRSLGGYLERCCSVARDRRSHFRREPRRHGTAKPYPGRHAQHLQRRRHGTAKPHPGRHAQHLQRRDRRDDRRDRPATRPRARPPDLDCLRRVHGPAVGGVLARAAHCRGRSATGAVRAGGRRAAAGACAPPCKGRATGSSAATARVC